MSRTMAIVLPSRKKKSDIFAPSKAIQDAKEKIGPAYFDISLLECSRNAVELTKLIGKWEELDKERLKIIKDIDREEELLVRTLKAHRIGSDKKQDKSRSFIGSVEGIETVDGKIVPPGFRYRSNGEIKPSTLTLPLVNVDDKDKDDGSDSANSDVSIDHSRSKTVRSSKKVRSRSNGYFEREIYEIETIIRDIHKNLSKYNIGNEKFPSSEKFKTFLRSHRNNTISSNEINYLHFNNNPNDRFAFKPGTTSKLHKNETKTPTFRTCTGCKFKMKCAADDDKSMARARSEDLAGRRRWSYVPNGRYVQSATTIFPRSSKSSVKNLISKTEQSQSVMRNNTKSTVQFKTSTDEITSRAISAHGIKVIDLDLSCDLTPECKKSPLLSARSKKSLATVSRRSLSAMSAMSGFSSSRLKSTPNLLIDHESRLDRFKRLQDEEQQHCDIKVRNFINKLGSSTNT